MSKRPFPAHRTLPSNSLHRRAKRRTLLESLERRELFAADFRTIDGAGNNLTHDDWGSAGIDLLRRAAAAYGDGISTPAGADRPNARAISEAVAAQSEDTRIDRNLSAFIYVWGQFLDHDLDLTGAATPREAFNISVSTGDPDFDPAATGTKVIPLSRSQFDPATGTSTSNPRQQVNTLTAWLDGSQIYGSDDARALALRTMSGGRLKTSGDNMMPRNTDGLANANDAHILPDDQLFVAGDVRANENVELTSLHTLFLREHNRLADKISSANPGLSDEEVYQRARRIVIAELQAITYNEFLPALLGDNSIKPYRGYNSAVNPGITNEFSTAAFRVGHSLLGDDVEFMDNNGNALRDEVPLAEAFFNPTLLDEFGVDPVLKYLASTNAQQIDNQIVDGVRNFLFGPPGAGGLDLAALNIQRGRDHGLADFNSTRAAYGLPRVTSFAQITSDIELQGKLQALYGDVNHIDLWVGGLAEDHALGAAVGPTFQRILADQFQRLRDGDRFWYQNDFAGRELQTIQNTKLSDILRRNTDLTNLQENVFVFNPAIVGRVFADGDRDGRIDRGETGLAGVTVELLDSTGTVVASTQSDRTGNYRFNGLDIGSYQVREVLPNGKVRTSAISEVAITRGMVVSVNIGLAASGNRPTTPQRPERDPRDNGPRGPIGQNPRLVDQVIAGFGMPGQGANRSRR